MVSYRSREKVNLAWESAGLLDRVSESTGVFRGGCHSGQPNDLFIISVFGTLFSRHVQSSVVGQSVAVMIT